MLPRLRGRAFPVTEPTIASRLVTIAREQASARGSADSADNATSTPAFEMAALCSAAGVVVATFSCDPERGPLTIGRGAAADVRLDDPFLSAAHAQIAWDAGFGTHVITDTGSTNGVYVNGQRIYGRVCLQDGVRIRLGRTRLRYQRNALVGRASG